MSGTSTTFVPQKATRNSSGALIRVPKEFPDTVSWWVEQYFRFEVTTSSSSQKVQRRDIQLFVSYMIREEGGTSASRGRRGSRRRSKSR
jgi:hypothetical protein